MIKNPISRYCIFFRQIINIFFKKVKLKNIYLFIKSILKSKKFRILYFDEQNIKNHKQSNFCYELNKDYKFTNNKFHSENFNIKSVTLRNITYRYFLMQNAFVMPNTNVIFTKKNCWLGSREQKTKGKNFFEIHEFDNLKNILLGNNKYYKYFFKFNSEKDCIIDSSIFSSQSNYKEGISLLSAINNYWHFLIEIAPKILLANHLNIPKDIPFLIMDNLHQNLYEILYILNSKIDNRKIIKIPSTLGSQMPIKISNLYNISDHMNLPLHIPKETNLRSCNFYFDKKPIVELINIVQEHYQIKNEIDNKIKLFLYRENTWRISKDQEKLKQMLIGKGYQVFNPEKMSFRDQVEIVSKASSFIGFSGAGFANALFLPIKSKKILIANSYYGPLVNIWDYLLENIDFIENANKYEFGNNDVHGSPYLSIKNWELIDELTN